MSFDLIFDYLGTLLWSGWTGLLDYLAAHVLLCLVPAFVIAGYMSAMIPKEAITRYLGPRAPKYISYPAAAIGGFVLAVCSCTILPLFAGIWKRGAGLGVAITFLFVGPAVNILAIAYTGAAIGMDIALARIVLSILFGITIGMVMAWLFRAEESKRAADMASAGMFDQHVRVKPAVWLVFLMLIGVLIVGTLQVDVLTRTWTSFSLPVEIPSSWMVSLTSVGLNPQGALLILMLVLITPMAYLGMERVLEGFNRWTYASIAMVGLTLLLAAPVVSAGSLVIGVTGRFVAEVILLAAIGVVAARGFERHELAGWFWETWKFVKQIFPLLIIGVFLAGVVKVILPESWIQTLAGRNTLWANFAGVVFGVFMYFPTLVEVPIAKMFLDLGMHRGPLLAYLLADPELSLQSILVTGKILGRRKTAAYVVLVSVFSTLAGYVFGLFMAAL
ncbi:MAG TPA: permease [Anaerolineales bacterium]